MMAERSDDAIEVTHLLQLHIIYQLRCSACQIDLHRLPGSNPTINAIVY